MTQYLWNKFWLGLARFAVFRTTLIDFPCYADAEGGIADCEEFNAMAFGPTTINTPCPSPVDGNKTVGECMNAGWCGCVHGPRLERGYEPWATTSEKGDSHEWRIRHSNGD